MLSSIANKLAGQTYSLKPLQKEVAKLRTFKAEIDIARCCIDFDAEFNITSINQN